MEGLDWQLIQLPFAAGLNQRMDDRARPAPYLDICKDVQFDELGGMQTRYPYATLGALSDCRRVVDNAGELLVFTKTQLKSWDAANSAWITKGTHLAVKVEEETVFATTGDQIDQDRAELNNTITYAWADGTSVYVAARNKTTGAVILSPTAVASAARPRLVAVDNSILLFYIDTGTHDLKAKPLDTTSLASSVAATANTVVSPASTAHNYDVTRIIGTGRAVGAIQTDSTHYVAFTVDNAADVIDTASAARAANRVIAVSSTPDGLSVQVIRAHDGPPDAVKGDLITIAGLVDTAHVDVAIATPSFTVEHITCAHRSVQDSGKYRCYAFWSGGEGDTASSSESSWIDTSGTTGTAATFVIDLALASRAFDYDGRVYVHLTFAGVSTFVSGASPNFSSTLQNTYFLYRDDALLVAKMAAMRAGGYPPTFSHLPGVQLTDGTATFSWCGSERRIVPLGTKHSGYSDRGPRDITFTFDSNEARRCVRLGKTLYITGGEVMQYDGTRLVEVGFHIFPWLMVAVENGSGSIADGSYTYKITWRWSSGTGERDRSTTATHGDVTLTGGTPQGMGLTAAPLHVTHKTDNAPAVEFWRTAKDPLEDSPFYLASSSDPASTSNPNRYLANDTTATLLSAFDDEFADADLTENEGDSEGEGILANLAPPPCTIIAASDTRLFLAGVAGDPDRVWYSLLRGDGEVARFNGDLTIDVPPPGGDITALIVYDGTLYVFRQTAVYAYPGFGFDNTAGGQNFGPVRTLSTDVGAVSQEAVALTSLGILFKSQRGWYVLNGATPQDIGDPVSDYDTESVLAIDVMPGSRHIRILSPQRMLVLETASKQWGEWTISDGLDACIWQGSHVYLASGGPKLQGTTYTGLTYGMDVETTWIKPADLQGWARIRRIQALGEYRSAHDVRLRVAYDYLQSYVDDKTWTATPTTVGGPEQVGYGPSRQRCRAFKVRITAQAVGATTPPTGEALKLTGLGIELGNKRGLKRLPASQKAV